MHTKNASVSFNAHPGIRLETPCLLNVIPIFSDSTQSTVLAEFC